jgi:integrase
MCLSRFSSVRRSRSPRGDRRSPNDCGDVSTKAGARSSRRVGADRQEPGEDGRQEPATEAREIHPLTDEKLDRVVGEIGDHGPLVTFAAETGLRPCEWLALERRDVDKSGRVLYVEREHVAGETKPYGKTAASRRRVQLTAKALDAIEALPPRLNSKLVSRPCGAAT